MTPTRRSAALALLCALSGSAAAANPAEAPPPSRAAATPAPVPARELATSDLLRAQRLAIAALQDLGFALESADAEHGTVTASRLDTHPLRLAVTLTSANASTVTATVATDYAGIPLADPRPAEAFFAALAARLTPPRAID